MKNLHLPFQYFIIAAITTTMISCEGSVRDGDGNEEKSEHVSVPITNLDDVIYQDAREIHSVGAGFDTREKNLARLHDDNNHDDANKEHHTEH